MRNLFETRIEADEAPLHGALLFSLNMTRHCCGDGRGNEFCSIGFGIGLLEKHRPSGYRELFLAAQSVGAPLEGRARDLSMGGMSCTGLIV